MPQIRLIIVSTRTIYDPVKPTKKGRQSVDSVLANSRAAAKSGGHLFATLRIPHYDTCLAVIDSATAAGWKFSFSESSTVKVAADEVFPMLCFTASSIEEHPNDSDLLRWWVRSYNDHEEDALLHNENATGKYAGGEALFLYRELKDKHIRREESRTYDDGHTMRLECGSVGDRFYRFKIATNGSLELELRATEVLSDLWQDRSR